MHKNIIIIIKTEQKQCTRNKVILKLKQNGVFERRSPELKVISADTTGLVKIYKLNLGNKTKRFTYKHF